MTPLMALLSLGLSVGTETSVQAGTLVRPILWADPSSVVPQGSPVTLWCQGTPDTKKIQVIREGSSLPWKEGISLPENKMRISISAMTKFNTGTYHCSSQNGEGRFVHSDPLELVVTGLYHKPFLSALPSSRVNSGQIVTLQCDSEQGFDMFTLIQEGDPKMSWTLNSLGQFFVGPMTPGRKWMFRCYGYYKIVPQQWSYPSDPLELLVLESPRNLGFPTPWPRPTSGLSVQEEVLPRPIFWVNPGSVVPQWSPVTFWCEGTPGAQVFHLHKKGSSSPLLMEPLQAPGNQATFSFPYITEVDAGTYYCSYFSLAGWSVHSTSLRLIVSGLYSKPSLSALPSSIVASGGNVTLQCDSEQEFDWFILIQEGDAETPLISQPPTGHLQTLFLVGPLTPEHRWTFRCYGHLSHTPNQWSEPSDLLQLLVSETSHTMSPSQINLVSKTAFQPRAYTMENLIRLGVGGFILLVLGILLLEAWYSQRRH